MYFKLLTLNLCVTCCVFAGPIYVKSAVLKDHSRNAADGVRDHSSGKGISSYENDAGFNKDNQKKYILAEDSGKYGLERADNRDYNDNRDVSNERYHKEGGGAVENVDSKEGHKKGHHNSGFKNSYHKDESGDNSSFYDDSDDQGDAYLQNSRQGAFGDVASNKNRESYYDGNRYSKDDDRHGSYGNSGLFDKNFGNERNYNQEKYHQDNAQQGMSNLGNREGEHGRYVEENYHTPHYGHGQYPEQGYYNSGYVRPRGHIRGESNYYNAPIHEYPNNINYDRSSIRRPISYQQEYYDGQDEYY